METPTTEVFALRRESYGEDAPAAPPELREEVARAATPRLPGIAGPLVLSIILAAVSLGVLISLEPWKFLAVTRILDLLIEGGFVQYHDRQPGFVAGVPLPKYYYWAQEAVDWRLVVIAALLMMLYPCIKAIQFDRIAWAYGSRSQFSQNFNAYLYGDSLDRFLPFNMGMVGTANILVAHGMDQERATAAVVLSRIFTVFEICAFALLGLFLVGWSNWLSHIFWAVVVCATAYYLVSISGRSPAAPRIADLVRIGRGDLLALPRTHGEFVVKAALLSLLAFGTVDVSVYILMAAFDTTVLAISVDPSVLLMGIVGGYIAARIVPVTPGGIGQWEIGFAATLLLADSDVSIPLLCIGFLANVLRIATGILLLAIVTRRNEIGTRLSAVFSVFAGGAATVREQRATNGHAPMDVRSGTEMPNGAGALASTMLAER